MTIRGHVQRAALGAKITLYEIDLTMFGQGMVRITGGTGPTGAINFGGELYSPHPVKASGYALTGQGSLPRPTLQVGNVDNSFTALVEQNDDLHGAIVTRIRTYERYLDSGEEPDGDAHLPLDVFIISMKTAHTDEIIAWQLAALTDQEGQQLPNRVALRDWCSHETRRWDAVAGVFDYTHVTCPYTGYPKDADGNPCAPEDEVFSKRLGTCCQARFGVTAVLPTRAFPGMARIANR